jgi:hypothetical protein
MVTHPSQADTLQAATEEVSWREADVASISDDKDDSYEPDDPNGSESGCDHCSKARSCRSGNNDVDGVTIPAGTTREESGAASGMTRRETWAVASTALAGCAACRVTWVTRSEAACLAATRASGATLPLTITPKVGRATAAEFEGTACV